MTARIRRRAAAAAIAALCLAAAPAGAATVTGEVTGLDAADIAGACPSAGLTIRLPEPNPYDDVPAGELPPGPLAGVEFTLRPVEGVDLTTAAGWVAARGMTVAAAEAAAGETAAVAVTDEGGAAAFPGLRPGLYLLTARAPEDPGHSYPDLRPLLITVPVGADGAWDCHPVVFAKTDPGEGPGPDPERPPWPAPWPGEADPGTPPPSTPAAPGDPGGTDAPGAPGSPGSPLPVTGAAVAGIAGVALLLLGAGLLAMRLGRRGDRDD
ncbi:SpaA isopeptide-forming pilin-related protein [Corynebacterium sphenisci]|uniref:SpaA isopeptide-forming pilin-related protein n=1 Tax=Corynebacterium sphenisci TaxID=191493 RepID=UPI0026E06B12|nr:SpaA isopeptide-forming pilin-related protein [Corynebacterium sphenisci]MDO5730965.1 SpaA isopeptide-forming pilin-related protein [Corynebacterium sphenisci]